MIWPSQRLKDNTRYIVALRYLENNQGKLVEPSQAFLALRLAINVVDGLFVPDKEYSYR